MNSRNFACIQCVAINKKMFLSCPFEYCHFSCNIPCFWKKHSNFWECVLHSSIFNQDGSPHPCLMFLSCSFEYCDFLSFCVSLEISIRIFECAILHTIPFPIKIVMKYEKTFNRCNSMRAKQGLVRYSLNAFSCPIFSHPCPSKTYAYDHNSK